MHKAWTTIFYRADLLFLIEVLRCGNAPPPGGDKDVPPPVDDLLMDLRGAFAERQRQPRKFYFSLMQ